LKPTLLFVRKWGEPFAGGEIVEDELINTVKQFQEICFKEVRVNLRARDYGFKPLNMFGSITLTCARLFMQTLLDLPRKECFLYGYDLRYLQPPANQLFMHKDAFRAYGEHLITLASILVRLRNSRKPHLQLFNSCWTKSNYLGRISRSDQAHILYPPVRQYGNHLSKVPTLVLTLARYTPAKNTQFVGELAEVLAAHKFTVMGFNSHKQNSYLTELRQKYKKVTFVENVSEDTKARELARAGFYLSPTPNEPFGMAILEAMSCGCIPVVHNSGGPMEFVPSKFRFDTLNEAVDIIKAEYSEEDRLSMREIASRFNQESFRDKFVPYFVEFLRSRGHRAGGVLGNEE
jgi:glycosyltransferase involved in cell wall biosynthesis